MRTWPIWVVDGTWGMPRDLPVGAPWYGPQIRVCICLHHLLSESSLSFLTPGKKTHISTLKRYSERPMDYWCNLKIYRSNGLRIKQTFYGKLSKDHVQSIAQAPIVGHLYASYFWHIFNTRTIQGKVWRHICKFLSHICCTESMQDFRRRYVD